MQSVNILGTEYRILYLDYTADPKFKENDCAGYTSYAKKTVVYCKMRTYPGWENEDPEVIAAQEDRMLRHEILHAFLNESGLGANTLEVNGWARNEEMIDWLAMQLPKIFLVFGALGIVTDMIKAEHLTGIASISKAQTPCATCEDDECFGCER